MTRASLKSVKYYVSVSIIQMGTLIFILSISGVYQPFYTQEAIYEPIVVSKPRPREPTVVSGKPLKLQIPAVGIDKELLDGFYNPSDASWTLTPRGVHYAVGSAMANDSSGSTFIYGHNNKHVFGPLPKLQIGDEAILYAENNLEFTYRYVYKETLKPDNTSPLSYTGTPRLTLQTCSGNWHQNRELFYFDLVSVRKLPPATLQST